MQISTELKNKILNRKIGRGKVMIELGINESQARKLIDSIRAGTKPVGKAKAVSKTVNATLKAKAQAVTKPKAHVAKPQLAVGGLSDKAEKRDLLIAKLLRESTFTQEVIAMKADCSVATVGVVKKRLNITRPKNNVAVAKSLKTKAQEAVAGKNMHKKGVAGDAKVPAKRNIKWLMGTNFINIIVDGKTFTADKTCPNFAKAAQLCMEDKLEEALSQINIAKAVQVYMHGSIKVEGDVVTYKDMVIDSGLTKRIIDAMALGQPFEHLVKFFENLMANPSYRAVTELFGFLQHNDIELTKDGCFIAFKRVNADYTDMHSGKFDNSPGKVVKMARNMVNEDSNQTCSAGLHVAAKSYLPHYGGGRGTIVSCKVNPRDVVAIPVDYKNAKMRCAEYEVLKDVYDTINIK